MAKFTPGPMVAAISGSQGGTVFSRNRYGAYTRFRAIPVTSTTEFALNAKSRLATASQAWNSISAAQRLSWKSWAAQNPVVDPLGQQQILAGNAAYIQLNARLAAQGTPPISAPPIVDAPTALLTLSATYDIGAGTFELAFTTTPLGAGNVLIINAAVVNSAGIEYVRNFMKQVGFSAAAQASPFDPQTLIEARFGALVVGQLVHYEIAVLDTATGLKSEPLKTSGTVITT